jgi:Transport and Golgi organisation 2
VCTVLLRLAPGTPWPVVCGAIRDEFADRPWDPPAAHWSGPWAGLLGGRDRTAGGTWLAVDPTPRRPALAALLNGVRRPLPEGRTRPTRGTLALDVLATGRVPDGDAVADYDGFHLVRATLDAIDVWSWDGVALGHRLLAPGDHIVVNLGPDAEADPLVPHFAPLLAATPAPADEGWGPWTALLQGDGLEPDDSRALLVRREIDGRTYASTSASLVALSPEGVRYAFNPVPTSPESWYNVET